MDVVAVGVDDGVPVAVTVVVLPGGEARRHQAVLEAALPGLLGRHLGTVTAAGNYKADSGKANNAPFGKLCLLNTKKERKKLSQ